MELIATSRFKKAMDRAAEAASYTKKINEIVADLSQSNSSESDSSFSHPLLQQPPSTENVAVLVLTSNRGLCGGYNSGILKKAIARVRELQNEGLNVDVAVSGKRGINAFKFEKLDMAQEYTQFEDKPGYDEVDAIASTYVKDFIEGKLHRLDVVYQSFLSAGRQVPVVETVLPFGDLATDQEESSSASVDYEFLPSPEEILEEIVPAAFKARFFKCFLDSAVGEQIARMVAMKSATESADEMIGDLSMKYNRARQSQITSELAEIIGGAAALE